MQHKEGDVVTTEHVNSFILSVCKIMKEMCMLDFKAGEPVLKKGVYLPDSSLVRIGFLSGFKDGLLILNINHNTALGIVSRLVMAQDADGTIDRLGQSAIAELGNMIAGNAATVFTNNNSNIIYITPPLYYTGGQYVNDDRELLSIPFSSEIGNLSVDILFNV